MTISTTYFSHHTSTRLFLLVTLLLGCLSITAPPSARATEPVHLEILHMNHGPMRPTIRNIKALLSTYGPKVQAEWFNYDQAEGKQFMKKKKLQGHFPMLIFINGKHKLQSGNKQIDFKGFPSGSGPFKSVEGEWRIDDLKNVLDALLQ